MAESVNALKDRKIDAFFWSGGIPTAAVTDLAATPGMTTSGGGAGRWMPISTCT